MLLCNWLAGARFLLIFYWRFCLRAIDEAVVPGGQQRLLCTATEVNTSKYFPAEFLSRSASEPVQLELPPLVICVLAKRSLKAPSKALPSRWGLLGVRFSTEISHALQVCCKEVRSRVHDCCSKNSWRAYKLARHAGLQIHHVDSSKLDSVIGAT